MTVVLRKSHGAFSAGTPVDLVDYDKRHKMNLVTPVGRADTELHVHDKDLVELRSRTDYVTNPRWLRRQGIGRKEESSQVI